MEKKIEGKNVVGKVESKGSKKTYFVSKVAVGDWRCTCSMKGNMPCPHKKAVWRGESGDFGKYAVRIYLPRLLKRGSV